MPEVHLRHEHNFGCFIYLGILIYTCVCMCVNTIYFCLYGIKLDLAIGQFGSGSSQVLFGFETIRVWVYSGFCETG